MSHQFHIVAGALAIFFLAVAIVKYITQASRKRKAKKESVARSKAENVSLHNPYPGEAPAGEAENEAAPAEAAPAAPADAPAPAQPAPAQPEQAPPQESSYKWN